MIIFAQKHYSAKQAKLYTTVINLAVYVRAFIAGINRFLQVVLRPFIDAVLLFAGIYFIKTFWAENIKDAAEYYPEEFTFLIVPIYIALWLLSVYFNGGYDKPVKNHRIIRGLLTGTVLIAAFYAFLPETLRFSRAIILLGGVWAIFSMIGIRLLAQIIFRRKIQLEDKALPKIIIVGSEAEGKRALNLMTEAGVNHRFLGFVLPENSSAKKENLLGEVSELEDICSIYEPDEIIFCSKDIPNVDIISWMTMLGVTLNYKIIPENSMSIIGSNSKNTAGDLYAIDINLNITTSMSQRNKRLFDIGFSILSFLLFPVLLFLVKQPVQFLQNIFSVLFGNKSWVGYDAAALKSDNYQFPKLRKGVLTPVDMHADKQLSEQTRTRLNLLYAKDYSLYKDLEIVWHNLKYLGRATA